MKNESEAENGEKIAAKQNDDDSDTHSNTTNKASSSSSSSPPPKGEPNLYEKMERISKLDKDPEQSNSKYFTSGGQSDSYKNALMGRKGNMPIQFKNLGSNKLAQAMAHDIMARDVESNLIRYTNFDEKPGKVLIAHNYISMIVMVAFFGLLVVYALYENFRTVYYGRDIPEVWGHVPIPWNDEQRIKEEYPQSMWPWQKDHPWQKYKQVQKDFEDLKRKMKESGEL